MKMHWFRNLRQRQLTKTVERHTHEGRARDAKRSLANRPFWVLEPDLSGNATLQELVDKSIQIKQSSGTSFWH
jgi:hypothetical protein